MEEEKTRPKKRPTITTKSIKNNVAPPALKKPVVKKDDRLMTVEEYLYYLVTRS